MERKLAALGNRVFLMNNVHDDQPTVFQSRWALSFLRGPLARADIQKLMAPRKSALPEPATAKPAAEPTTSSIPSPSASPAAKPSAKNTRPIVAGDVTERFVEPARTPGAKDHIEYRPALLGKASCHYVKASADIDTWVDKAWLAGQDGHLEDDVWGNAVALTANPWELAKEPSFSDATFAELPDAMLAARSYKTWQTQLKDYVYRHEPLKIFECAELKTFTQPGQDELDARLSLEQKMRELRDIEKEKLRSKYETQVRALETKIASAQQRASKENSEFMGSAIDVIGGTVLGMLLGNKRTRISTTTRGIGKAAQQRSQSQNAQAELQRLQAERAEILEQARPKSNA